MKEKRKKRDAIRTEARQIADAGGLKNSILNALRLPGGSRSAHRKADSAQRAAESLKRPAIARKHTGNTSKIRLKMEERFDSGAFGDVHIAHGKVLASAKDAKENVKYHGFVIKRYRSSDAGRALRQYAELKELGVKHLPTTFRGIDREKITDWIEGTEDILMTDFNAHGYRLYNYGFKDGSRGNARIEASDDFFELLQNVYDDVRLIVNSGRTVPGDCAFALIPSPEEGKPRLKPSFVYLDLDIFSKSEFNPMQSVRNTLGKMQAAFHEPDVCDRDTGVQLSFLVQNWIEAVEKSLARRGPPMPEYQEIQTEVEARVDFVMKKRGYTIFNN